MLNSRRLNKIENRHGNVRFYAAGQARDGAEHYGRLRHSRGARTRV